MNVRIDEIDTSTYFVFDMQFECILIGYSKAQLNFYSEFAQIEKKNEIFI